MAWSEAGQPEAPECAMPRWTPPLCGVAKRRSASASRRGRRRASCGATSTGGGPLTSQGGTRSLGLAAAPEGAFGSLAVGPLCSPCLASPALPAPPLGRGAWCARPRAALGALGSSTRDAHCR